MTDSSSINASTSINAPAPAGRPDGAAFGGWRKSHRSEPNGACVEVGTTFGGWRKSRRSEPNGTCVEIGIAARRVVGIRDSKAPHGPVLSLDETGWATLVGRIKSGALDLT